MSFYQGSWNMVRTFWVRLLEVNVWGNSIVLQGQDTLYDACDTGGTFGMAYIGLHLELDSR